MDKDLYNPEKLVMYHMSGHGEEIINTIYDAIRQADINNDVPYMIYFREELCEESRWYSDGSDILQVYPRILTLIDKYPDVERVHFQRYEKDAIEPVLWLYETFLETCISFYSIPLEDCKKYLDDFRKRWLAYGYSEREPYRMELEFCLGTGNMERAAEIFDKYNEITIEAYDRRAAYVNTKIKYYLLNNNRTKADGMADSVCGQTAGIMHYFPIIWLIRSGYLEYYILHGDYRNASEIAYTIEHSYSGEKEFMQWGSIMCAHLYNRTGRGLRIYKKHWKEWEEEKNPRYKFYAFKNAACFFKGLKKIEDTDTIKIRAGSLFPLYEEDNICSIDRLYKYYYREAEEIAKKFDQRNGTTKFTDELEISFRNA